MYISECFPFKWEMICSVAWNDVVHSTSTANLSLMYSLSPISKDISFMLINLSEKLTQSVGNLEKKNPHIENKICVFLSK